MNNFSYNGTFTKVEPFMKRFYLLPFTHHSVAMFPNMTS